MRNFNEIFVIFAISERPPEAQSQRVAENEAYLAIFFFSILIFCRGVLLDPLFPNTNLLFSYYEPDAALPYCGVALLGTMAIPT